MSAEGSEPGELVEDDHQKTTIPYDPTSRFPRALLVFWAVAMVSLAAYKIVYLLPDFLQWVRQ